MSKRGARWLRAGCVALAVTTAGACAPALVEPDGSLGHQARFSLEGVDELARKLECEQVRVLEDDVHFYDDMRGFDCWRGGDELLSFRAYDNANSPPLVLQDWDGLVGPQRRLLSAGNWFAVGTDADLRALAAALGVTRSSVADLPPRPRDDMTHMQMGIGVCATAVVTLVERVIVYKQPADAEEVDSHEAVFPGMRRITEAVLAKLKGRDVTSEDFAYVISRYGSLIKDACAHSVGTPR